jgi:hypothetical protein
MASESLATLINETTATKEDINKVKQDVTTLRSEMKPGFERIETLLLGEQKREIEDLKKQMKKLEDALAF